MNEELERKYLAIIQESLMEKLELREENKKLKEKLDNIAWRENVKNTNLDIVLEDLKMSIDGKYNENTKESNILDEDKKKVLLDYIDKKIAYYSESDLKNPISESMFHGRFAKELQKIRALLLCQVDTSSPWFDYHFS